MYQFDTAAFGNAQSQLNTATRQFADVAGKINRLALENAEQAFGLQLATFEENVNAAFAFWGEIAEVRDFDGLKTVWPKGVQIARENIERTVSTGQEVFGRVVKTNEAIAQIAKGQFENATAQANAEVEKATAEVQKAAKKATRR
ncbi:MAG TPA: phasin family protein [Xanthomonadaceae bacterium]|nr:phasin family protein [Xanthomonadaceae bacterium]